MSIRQAVFIAIVVLAVQIGTELYGGRFFLWYLVIVGALGLTGTIVYALRLRRIQRALASLDDSAQDDVLVALENVAERPTLAEALGRPQAVVPIRGGLEVFRYPRGDALVVRVLMYSCGLFAGFAALSWTSDVVLGRTQFVDPATTPWWERVLLIAGFSFGAIVMRWMEQATSGQLEISEEAVTFRFRGGDARTIPWAELTEAGTSELSDILWVRSGRTKIAVRNRLVDFGRAVNLVASRAALRSRWKGS